ncbi:hypothetical protein F511_10218 [Dorcoceras hygrometricum]|uniref:Uncharacterized protein n=1 Tax=Dorcoceras hygrometricum TaxID=472368 RepID=A0A2Z7AZ87_9LAMI|nr:hypothetical protein F511_10218 [Dorcoceras hygrometricum]
MGSNPSTESNYKSAMNSKDKMQMLCMKNGTTAKGYHRRKEAKELNHISTESATNSGHVEALVLVTVRSRRANTRINEAAPRVDYYTRNQQRRIPYASAGLCTCWFSNVSTGFDDEPRYDVVLHELATRRGIGNQLMVVVSAGYSVEGTMRNRFDYETGNLDTMSFRLMLRNQSLDYSSDQLLSLSGCCFVCMRARQQEEETSGEQPRVARDNYLDAGSAAGRINTS